MKPSIESKLNQVTARYEEIKGLLADPKVTDDLNRYRDLSKEYSQIEPLVDLHQQFLTYSKQRLEALALLDEDDAELQQLAKQEIKRIDESLEAIDHQLLSALIPKDPNDDNNIFLEIRAGTGGDEAAIFAGDLNRMYTRFAESQRYKIEIISESFGEHGGYKEIIMRVIGQGAFRALNLNQGCIACSAFLKRKRKVEFIPQLVQLRFCRNKKKLKILISTLLIFASIRFAPQVPAGSTCKKPIPPFASRTYQPVPWWNAKMNVRNIKTVRALCLY